MVRHWHAGYPYTKLTKRTCQNMEKQWRTAETGQWSSLCTFYRQSLYLYLPSETSPGSPGDLHRNVAISHHLKAEAQRSWKVIFLMAVSVHVCTVFTCCRVRALLGGPAYPCILPAIPGKLNIKVGSLDLNHDWVLKISWSLAFCVPTALGNTLLGPLARAKRGNNMKFRTSSTLASPAPYQKGPNVWQLQAVIESISWNFYQL